MVRPLGPAGVVPGAAPGLLRVWWVPLASLVAVLCAAAVSAQPTDLVVDVGPCMAPLGYTMAPGCSPAVRLVNSSGTVADGGYFVGAALRGPLGANDTNTGPATMTGLLQVASVGGTATFSSLTVAGEGAAGTYTLLFSLYSGNASVPLSPGAVPIAAVATGSFTVGRSLRTTRVTFIQSPVSVIRGGEKWNQSTDWPTVELRDDLYGGRLSTSPNQTVRLSAVSHPGGNVTVSPVGTVEVAPADGVAVFSDVGMNLAGSFVLHARSSFADVAEDVSAPFTVVIGPAAQILFDWGGGGGGAAAASELLVEGVAFPAGALPVLRLADMGGNQVQNETGTNVTVWLSQRPNATAIDAYLLQAMPWLQRERDLASYRGYEETTPYRALTTVGDLVPDNFTVQVTAGSASLADLNISLRITRPGPGYVLSAVTGPRNYTGQPNEDNTTALGAPLPVLESSGDPLTVKSALLQPERVHLTEGLRTVLTPMIWGHTVVGSSLLVVLVAVICMAYATATPGMHRRHYWAFPYILLLYLQYIQMFMLPLEHVDELEEVLDAWVAQRVLLADPRAADGPQASFWSRKQNLAPKVAVVLFLGLAGLVIRKYYIELCCTKFVGTANMVLPALLAMALPLLESIFVLKADDPSFMTVLPFMLLMVLLYTRRRLRQHLYVRDETAFFVDFIPDGRGLGTSCCSCYDPNAPLSLMPPPLPDANDLEGWLKVDMDAERLRFGKAYGPGDDEYSRVPRRVPKKMGSDTGAAVSEAKAKGDGDEHEEDPEDALAAAVAESRGRRGSVQASRSGGAGRRGSTDTARSGDDDEEDEFAARQRREEEEAMKAQQIEQEREAHTQQATRNARSYNPAAAAGWLAEAAREYLRWIFRCILVPTSSRSVQDELEGKTVKHETEMETQLQMGRMRNALYDLWERRRREWEAYTWRPLFEMVVVYEPSFNPRRRALAERTAQELAAHQGAAGDHGAGVAMAEIGRAGSTRSTGGKDGKAGGKHGKKGKKGKGTTTPAVSSSASSVLVLSTSASARYLAQPKDNADGDENAVEPDKKQDGDSDSDDSEADRQAMEDRQREADSCLHRLRGRVTPYWALVRLGHLVLYASFAVPLQGTGNISSCYTWLAVYLFALVFFAPYRNPYLQLDIMFHVLLIVQLNILLAVMGHPSRVWALVGIAALQWLAIPLTFVVCGYYREPPLRRTIAPFVLDPTKDPLQEARVGDFSARPAPLTLEAPRGNRFQTVENDAAHHLRVGIVYWNTGEERYRTDKRFCYSYFSTAAKMDQKNATALAYLGLYYLEVEKDVPKATRHWVEALRRDPMEEVAGRGLARLHIRYGNFQKAEELCQTAQLRAMHTENLDVQWPDEMLAEIRIASQAAAAGTPRKSRPSSARRGDSKRSHKSS